jgi:drug/metabolite transporter (DMT)-like permease
MLQSPVKSAHPSVLKPAVPSCPSSSPGILLGRPMLPKRKDPAIRRPAIPPARLAYVAIVLGVLALGCSALFVRWAAAPGPVTGLYRMALATLVLTPLALRRPTAAPRAWPRTGVILALLGGLSLSVDLALWNTAVGLTSAANATLFANTAPLWVALVAWIVLGERLRPLFWGGLALTLLGAAAVAGADFQSHAGLGLGDLLAILASFFYAGYYLLTQFGRRYLRSAPYVWVAGLASSASLLAISLLLGLPITGYPPATYLWFVALALITQAFGYLAVGYALGHLPASVVSPTMVGQPVVTALLAIPLLSEPLSLTQIVGGTAVLIGIVLVHRSRLGAKMPEPEIAPQSAD